MKCVNKARDDASLPLRKINISLKVNFALLRIYFAKFCFEYLLGKKLLKVNSVHRRCFSIFTVDFVQMFPHLMLQLFHPFTPF